MPKIKTVRGIENRKVASQKESLVISKQGDKRTSTVWKRAKAAAPAEQK
jgi:hypothetical protein